MKSKLFCFNCKANLAICINVFRCTTLESNKSGIQTFSENCRFFTSQQIQAAWKQWICRPIHLDQWVAITEIVLGNTKYGITFLPARKGNYPIFIKDVFRFSKNTFSYFEEQITDFYEVSSCLL